VTTLSGNIASGIEPYMGPINVELGWVGILLRRQEVVAVLGPGRYSRFRLYHDGVTPLGLSVMRVRTASVGFSTRVNGVPLDDGSIVDLDVTVRVALRIESEPAQFFVPLLREYGLDWASLADEMVQQMIEEAIRGAPGTSDSLASAPGELRSGLGKRLAPSEIFRVVEVVSLTVGNWDPHVLATRVAIQEIELGRLRELGRIETESLAGNLRAQSCVTLGRALGVDPRYFWDPGAYAVEAAAQRDGLVQLLGQYGHNLAMLADVLEIEPHMLGELLGPALRGQGIVSDGRVRPAPVLETGRSGSGSRCVLSTDAEIRLLRGPGSDGIVGGVFRQLLTNGDRMRLAIVVHEPSAVVDIPAIEHVLGTGVTVAAVPSSSDPSELLRRIVLAVVGLEVDSGDVEWVDGQLVWAVPAMLKQSPVEGAFLAESICDVFDSPAVIPVE
jgi:hypothetical protein